METENLTKAHLEQSHIKQTAPETGKALTGRLL